MVYNYEFNQKSRLKNKKGVKECQQSHIDFMHLSSMFLVSKDKAIPKNDNIHDRKLQKIISDIHETSIIDNASHNPNKVIYNFPD